MASLSKALLADSESIEVIGQHLFLHAPNGVGRSRFAKGVEKTPGMSVTARNWRTFRGLDFNASKLGYI
jgi:uncharacterized protein (DUF1697 family)